MLCTEIVSDTPCSAKRRASDKDLPVTKKSYQIEAGVCPNINPGQGMSDPVGALRICHESSRGTPHVELLSGSISK